MISVSVSLTQAFLNIKVEEGEKHEAIEQGVEEPGAHAVAAAFPEMEHQNPHVPRRVRHHQNNPTHHHERETPPPHSHLLAESVSVHQREHQAHRKNGQNLERLRELQPQKRHADEDGVVREVEHRELPGAPEEREEGADDVEEAGEVEHVRPEEDSAGGARAQGEAQQPLERGLVALPEPPRVADFGHGGAQHAGEDGGGDDGHGQAVEGRDGPQWDGLLAAEEVAEEDVEGGGDGNVGRDGGDEEPPRRRP